MQAALFVQLHAGSARAALYSSPPEPNSAARETLTLGDSARAPKVQQNSHAAFKANALERLR
eukprot:3231819-Pleurochrysis_carterae.AAC.3